MSDEKSGCLGWFIGLFGKKPHHLNGENPAVKGQTNFGQMASVQQAEQPAPALKLLQEKPPLTSEIEIFPYKIYPTLLRQSELVFYRTLASVVGKRALICPKVRLGDVFFVIDFKENLLQYFLIAKKHVDFLLCNPQTTKPIVGIELDDEGHQQRERKERDKFVKRVFEAAGLPLVHIPVQPRYNVQDLATRLAPYFGEELVSQDAVKS